MTDTDNVIRFPQAPAGWTRIRPDDGDWSDLIDWPDQIRADHLLIYSPCDGYHIWWRHARYCPPGTHYASILAPPGEPQYKVESPLS